MGSKTKTIKKNVRARPTINDQRMGELVRRLSAEFFDLRKLAAPLLEFPGTAETKAERALLTSLLREVKRAHNMADKLVREITKIIEATRQSVGSVQAEMDAILQSTESNFGKAMGLPEPAPDPDVAPTEPPPEPVATVVDNEPPTAPRHRVARIATDLLPEEYLLPGRMTADRQKIEAMLGETNAAGTEPPMIPGVVWEIDPCQ